MKGKLAILLIVTTVLTAFGLWYLNLLQSSDTCLCCASTDYSQTGLPILSVTIHDPQFLWAPDGKHLLYQDDSGNIYWVNVEDRDAAEIEQDEVLDGYEPTISADSQYLALIGDPLSVNVHSYVTKDLLFSIPDASLPLWVPKREQLVVSVFQEDKSEIVMVDPKERDAPLHSIDWIEENSYPVSWSPGGRFLAVTTTDVDEMLNGLADKLYVADMDARVVKPVANVPGCQRGASWSPNGSHIAFTANPTLSSWDMFISELDNGEPLQLDRTADVDKYQPSWSPSGTQIVYVGVEESAADLFTQDIYTIEIHTGQIRRLTNSTTKHESLPLWSPDGNTIAYLSFEDNKWYLNVINPDGSSQQRITVASP